MKINSIMVVAGLVSAIALTSCGPLGKYHKEKAEVVPENLYGRGIEAAEDSTIADVKWDVFFKDTCLRNCIRIALDNNKDLQLAMERIKQADAALLGSKLAYIPSIAISPSIGTYVENKSAALIYPITAAASWELNIFKKTANLRNSQAVYAQSKDTYLAVRSSIIASVANTYYSLLGIDESLRVARGMEMVWKETLHTIRVLKFEGFADEVAVSQYEATYAKILIKIKALETSRITTENALSLLMGSTPVEIERGYLTMQELPDTLVTGVPARMLARRPDVLAAGKGLEAAFYTTKAAWLSFFPSLTIEGSFDLLSITGTALASLTAPILSAGVNTARLKNAESLQEQARINFEKTVLVAGMEVNDAIAEYKDCCEKTELYQHQVYHLQQARNDTEELMANGQNKTYLDVLTAENSLFDAQFDRIDNMAKRLMSVVSLYQALGGGVD